MRTIIKLTFEDKDKIDQVREKLIKAQSNSEVRVIASSVSLSPAIAVQEFGMDAYWRKGK